MNSKTRELFHVVERLTWLDIAKGITIILMVAGHSSMPSIVQHWIFSFHMPFFFLASGLTTNWEGHFLEFVSKKTRGLIVPFVTYSIIVEILMVISGVGRPIDWYKGWQDYALWFVPVLYVALLLGRFFHAIPSFYGYVWIVLLFCASWLLSFCHIKLPWNLSVVPFAAGLVVLGSLFRQLVNKLSTYSRWWLLPVFLASICCSYFFHLDMARNQVIPTIPLVAGAIIGSLFIALLSIQIEAHSILLSKLLQHVGKETYLIMAFSQITIMLLNEYLHINMKYIILLVVIIVLKYVKDKINKMLKIRIL